MEDFPLSKTTIVSDLFHRHLDALRGRFPEFSNTMFVVAPECNMGRDSTELAHAVIQYRDRTPQHRGKILILDDDPTNFGLRTGGPNPLLSKDNMRATAAPTINGRRLRFHSNMVCVCDQIRGTTADVVMNRFVDQLQRYGADIERPADPSKPAKLRWHGKRGSTHDDLAMAFQLNLVANELFMRRPAHYGGRNRMDLQFS
jgi:hypothetical protein